MTRLRRALTTLALALGAMVLAAAAWDVATYDKRAWLADYARLKRDMAQGYANLDWMVEERGIDLVALDRRTSSELENAHSRVRAFMALRRFVRGFDDPHFRMKPGQRPEPEPKPEPAPATVAAPAQRGSTAEQVPVDAPAGADCAAAGYEEGDHAFRLPFERISGWTPLRGGDFPSGLIGATGVLRIAQFGEDQYLAACQAVFRSGMGKRELQLAVRARQQALLLDTLADLRRRGATRLLVDVSGNGGGTEWVSSVIELMTDRPLTRREPRIVGPSCDRGAVWLGKRAPCPAYAQAESETSTLRGTGAWRGPLLLVADGGTGSAAEDFVVWLQQNQVAKVIGERTAGAGCGYVDGGTVTRLSVVPVDVMMPNCSRFLADGTNEVEGIRPDLPLQMRGRDPADVAESLARLLAGNNR